MFLRNKFLLFLLACTIANPCFGDGQFTNLVVRDIETGNLVVDQEVLNNLNANITNLNAYIGNLNTYVSNITTGDDSLSNLLSGTNGLKAKIDSLQKLIDDTDASNTLTLSKQISALQVGVTGITTDLGTLQNLVGANGTLTTLSTNLSTVSNNMANMINRMQNISIRPIVLNLGCAEGYYVAKCGDINLDLNTILGYVWEYYNIKPSCWNQDNPYEEMRYLLHLDNDDNATYTKYSSTFRKYFSATNIGKVCGDISDDESGLYGLQKLRKDIFDTCISSSYVCKKCPNDGTTDVKTELGPATSDTPAYWKSFNTIADCFTQGGSDAKGTFTVEENEEPDDKCYYDYYSE